jgi:hypothetical protein
LPFIHAWATKFSEALLGGSKLRLSTPTPDACTLHCLREHTPDETRQFLSVEQKLSVEHSTCKEHIFEKSEYSTGGKVVRKGGKKDGRES